MTYLTAKQIFLIHSMIIDETGGTHGVRDFHAVLSLEKAPRQKVFGKELYRDVFSKAAVYAENIIRFHPFLDGNKRTGITVASIFIESNGWKITAREGEIEKFALEITKNNISIDMIAKWFEQYSRRARK